MISQTEEQKITAFKEFIDAGGQVEATDWMPEEYRNRVALFVEMHANSEIMGALPEREWILRAPSLQRKLTLTAKIQDEVGHGHLLYRIAEDLGKKRDTMIADLIAGKTKFHNVFHYPTFSWADVAIIGWLVDGAAVVSQSNLLKCSYAPYARCMKRICWEEAFHLKQGEDAMLTMMMGTDAQRSMVQEALNRWWQPLMMFHGPPSSAEKDRDMYWRIKEKGNEDLRQEYLKTYVPRILEIGLTIPDPALYKDENGVWHYTAPDWDELTRVSRNHGMMSQYRLAFRKFHFQNGQWVRDALNRVELLQAAD